MERKIAKTAYILLVPLIICGLFCGMYSVKAWKICFAVLVADFLNAAFLSNALEMKRRTELIVVGAMGVFFFFAMSQNDLIWRRYSHGKLMGLIIALSVAVLAMVYYQIREIGFGNTSGYFGTVVKRHWLIGLILVVFVLLSLPGIHLYQVEDGYWYQDLLYEQFAYFDLWTKNISDLMILHKTFAYALWTGMGRLIVEDGPEGYLMMQVLEGAFAVYAFYRCLLTVFKDAYVEAAVFSAVFAFSPYLFGQTPILSMDFGVLCFGTLFFLTFLKDYDLLIPLMGISFLFTKETSSFLYAGIIFGAFLAEWIFHRGKYREIRLKKYFLSVVPGALWIGLYFLLPNGWGAYEGVGGEINTIAFPAVNFWEREKQYLFLNFNWLLLLLLCFGILRLVIQTFRKNGKTGKNEERAILMGMSLGALLFLIIFFAIFYTYLLPRYIMSVCIGYGFLLAIVFLSTRDHGKKDMLSIVAGGILAILMLGQSYGNIDPVSNHVFYEIYWGNGTILNCINSTYIDDYMALNREFMGYAEVFEKAATEGGFEEGTIIITPPKNFTSLENGQQYGRAWLWDAERGRMVAGPNSVLMPVEALGSEEIEPGTHVIFCEFGDRTEEYDLAASKMTVNKEYVVNARCFRMTCLEGIWK